MQNQPSNSDSTMPDQEPDTVGPTETEMPDATAIDERIASGQEKEDAEAAFGGEGDSNSSS